MWDLLDQARHFPSRRFRESMILDFGLKELGLQKEISEATVLAMAGLIQETSVTDQASALGR